MKRKLIFIFFGIVILSAIGIAIGLWLQPKTTPPVTTQIETTDQTGKLPDNTTGAPNTGQNQEQPLVSQPQINNPALNTNPAAPEIPSQSLNLAGSLVSVSASGKLSLGPDSKSPQFYDSSSGYFYRYQNGSKQIISQKQFNNATDVVWDKAGTKAFVAYADGKAIVDFKNNRVIDLPPEVVAVNFSPTGEQIVFKTDSPNTHDNYLAVMNTDGSGVKFIEPIGDKGADVQTMWSPNNQVVAFFRKGTDAERQEVYFLGQNNENFKSVPLAGRGFIGNWSPDGQNVLYQVYNLDTNFTPRLYVMGGAGDNIGASNRALNLATSVDKCVWQNTSTVICGVPRSMPEGAGWMPKLLDAVPDSLYKIDLTTGVSSFLGWPQTGSQDISVKNPVISGDGKILYFTDGLTDSLVSVPLP